MSEPQVVDVPADVLDRCYINDDQYAAMYERSISDPDGFWVGYRCRNSDSISYLEQTNLLSVWGVIIRKALS